VGGFTIFVEANREMRGRVRVFSIVAILTAVFAVSAVFASGIVNPSGFTSSTPALIQPNSPGTTVFVVPSNYFKDYSLQPVGSKFTVYINITTTDALDLYTWQINMTWNKAILNMSKFTANEFLARSSSPTSSETLGLVINVTNNAAGTSSCAETLLGASSGIAGPTSGRLVSVEFKVVGYGSCDLIISTTGTLATTLLTSTGSAITTTVTKGYFSNKLIGDINGDRTVDGVDFGLFAKAFGSTNVEADLNKDGTVDGVDFGLFAKNFGRSV
jgi:hypothetical protein